MATRSKQKRKTTKVGRSQPRCRKYVRFNIPYGEVARIQKEWLEGTGDENTITALAKKYGRSRDTVSAIVHCPEMKDVAVGLLKKLVLGSADKIADRIEYELGNKKSDKGADIAMDLLERWGVLPPRIRIVAVPGNLQRDATQGFRAVDPDKQEDSRVKDLVMKLTEVTMERGRIFGMPMPELEEFEKQVAAEKEVHIPLNGKRQEE